MLKTIGKTCYLKLIFNNFAPLSSKIELPGHGLTNIKKKVGNDNLKVTLISHDEEISVVSLAEAEKISKRRDLKLVKILDLDTKTRRPVYKLMTGHDFYEEELKKRSEKREARKEPSIKGEKFAPISSNIGQHDLDTHLRKLSKWLLKFYEVRVVINGDGKHADLSDQIFSRIEKETSQIGCIKQKHAKGGHIKFQIVPFLKIHDNENAPKNQTGPAQVTEDNKNTL